MSWVDLGKVGMSDMALKNEVTYQKGYTARGSEANTLYGQKYVDTISSQPYLL